MKKWFFVDKANPIGVVKTGLLDSKITALRTEWNAKYPNKAPSWWEVWKKNEANLTAVVSFILNCVDDLILAVATYENMPGADKKATVLSAAGTLYDYIAKEALPIWLIPIAGRVRYVVIYVILSYAIDFIVNKYQNGLWREDAKPQEETNE